MLHSVHQQKVMEYGKSLHSLANRPLVVKQARFYQSTRLWINISENPLLSFSTRFVA